MPPLNPMDPKDHDTALKRVKSQSCTQFSKSTVCAHN
uniref:Uncharacterized protein n=1 Tax=Rhizophora mucronata TaxID=61149 RepID=A0A2P2JG51_RHIMU